MGVTADPTEFTVSRLAPGEEGVWAEFLGRADRPTLFHDLEFLAYHPRNKFDFHHLVLRRQGKIVALLPGGLVETGGRTVFSSPVGASVGGLVVAPELRAEMAVALVEALQRHAVGEGWGGIEMTLPPSFYGGAVCSVSFALFCKGFTLQHRWLCHWLPLEQDYERVFRSRQAAYVRASMRKGITTVETGPEGLESFKPVFRDTFARHGVVATHTEAEIADLMARFPGSIRLHLAKIGGKTLGGLLVFHLNSEVACTFYICRADNDEGLRADAVAIAGAMDRLRDRGFKYLDLGPSASDMNFNRGVAFFKEGLGALTDSRDRWRWDAD